MLRIHAAFTLLCLCFSFGLASAARGDNWPGWRGGDGSGYSSDTRVPTVWSAEKNVLWKRPTPGTGHSSPIVWGDTIVITYADPADLTRHVMAVGREAGELLWDTVVAKGAIEKMHNDNSPASATPVTDGKHIYVTFCIENKLTVCSLDFLGKLQWQTFVGDFESQHGFSTSLVLVGQRVILSGLQDGPDAFVAALETKGGNVAWKVPRDQHVRSFSVPAVVSIQGEPAIVLSGSNQTIAYDAATGRTLWTLDGPASKTVSSIVVAHDLGMAFVCGGRDDQFFAVRYDQNATDEISEESLIAWEASKGIPYVTSPYYRNGLLHVVSDDGIHRTFDAASGQQHGSRRVAGKVEASMVGIGENVLITDSEGQTTVLRNSSDYEVVAKNSIGEPVLASPAISNGDLIIRGTKHLFLVRQLDER